MSRSGDDLWSPEMSRDNQSIVIQRFVSKSQGGEHDMRLDSINQCIAVLSIFAALMLLVVRVQSKESNSVIGNVSFDSESIATLVDIQ